VCDRGSVLFTFALNRNLEKIGFSGIIVRRGRQAKAI
jgi:hypothetical protein